MLRSDRDDTGSEILAFKICQEEYGIDILSVQEIRPYEAVTRIANAPDYIKGLVNLRGVIVPIVDMRLRFGLANPRYDSTTVVIILNVGTRTVGMVVDSVSDVTRLTPEQIRPAPDMGSTLSAGYLTGLGVIQERMLILIDIAKLMSAVDVLGHVDKLAA